MTSTTYFPRIIHVKGRRHEIAVGLSGFIGNIPACRAKVRNLRQAFKAEGLSYVVRRYCCNYVTYRPT
jgi:hypothetical protein